MNKPTLLFSALFVAGLTAQGAVHVSLNGNDDYPGTVDKPKKSIAAGVAAARAGDGEVLLKGGIYRVTETVELPAAEDARPLTIRAVPGEEVIVAGGKEIPAAMFKKLNGSEAMHAMLGNKARKAVYSAALAGSGLETCFPAKPDVEMGGHYAMLAWNGHMLQQARWPNRGYGYHQKVLDKGASTRWLKPDEKPQAYSFDKPSGAVFTVHDEIDFKALDKELAYSHDMAVQGYLAVDWLFEAAPAAKFDAKNKTVQLLHHTRYGFDFKDKRMPRRFQIVNALSQLDEPGEWYFDQREKRLYVWPVQPVAAGKPFTVVGGGALFAAKGADHITLENISFENFGDIGVSFEEGSHILVAGCTFRNGADLGLRLAGGSHNMIQSCDFYGLNRAFNLLGQAPREEILNDTSISFNDANTEFIKSGYTENRRNLIQEHNAAVNNHIYNCRLRGYGLLAVGGVGATFSHNLMHGVNGGMMYGHNDLVMEYNEFYDVGYEMGDWNVAYSGADKSMYNNQVRYNFFHHMMCTPTAYGIAAIRADDGGSGLRLFGNIFYKTGESSIQWSGPHNSIENCVTLQMKRTWHSGQFPYHMKPKEEAVKEQWEEYVQMQKDVAAGEMSPHAKENYIGRLEMVIGKEGWKTNARWREVYPNFRKPYMDFMDPHCNPWDQSCGIVRNNYHENATWKVLYNHGRNQTQSFADLEAFLPESMIVEVPHDFKPQKMFVDADRMDFRVRDGFQFVEGFEPIPFEKIGLYQDEYRTAVPDKATYRNAVKDKYEGIPSHGGKLELDRLNERFPAPAYLK